MKVLGILNRKFIPCVAIKLRFQKLRPYRKKFLLLSAKEIISQLVVALPSTICGVFSVYNALLMTKIKRM
jgi:hypothetical protein